MKQTRDVPPVISEASALQAAACLFDSFGKPARLAVIQHLTLGEHRVVDLTTHLNLPQATVSAHCACLLSCGVLHRRTQGRATVYSLAHPEATMELLAAAEKMLALTGDAVTLCPTFGIEAKS
ncbi:ArsR/SmtB family transcription factor [Nocardioides aurantiacus]|uniref:ArsR/SmtB family transcription factor n=1 Tax=Nocardioides aurantiacus TaxID=86796 RepID=UPI00403FB215